MQKGLSSLIILILIGIILIGGFLYWKMSQPTSTNPNISSNGYLSPSPTPNVDTANLSPLYKSFQPPTVWKVYNATSFTLKYPPNWTFIATSEGCGPVFSPYEKSNLSNWLTICEQGNGDKPVSKQAESYLDKDSTLVSKDVGLIDGNYAIKQIRKVGGLTFVDIFVDYPGSNNSGMILSINSNSSSQDMGLKYLQTYEDLISTIKIVPAAN